jgi:DNA-binding NarL/FixJ family response regulator
MFLSVDGSLNVNALGALEELLAEPKHLPRSALVRLAGSIGADTVVSHAPAARARLGVPVIVVRKDRGPDLDISPLTPREIQVARLIADGLSNREVARRLLISVATVKDHVHSILTKTGLPGRAAVAARMR